MALSLPAMGTVFARPVAGLQPAASAKKVHWAALMISDFQPENQDCQRRQGDIK
jgi:hypothetical protein